MIFITYSVKRNYFEIKNLQKKNYYESGREKFEKRIKLNAKKKYKKCENLWKSLIFELKNFQSISGENDVDQLSRYFTKQEDENFALFSYVNELSYEVEVLNDTVQKIRDDIGKLEIVVFNCCLLWKMFQEEYCSLKKGAWLACGECLLKNSENKLILNEKKISFLPIKSSINLENCIKPREKKNKSRKFVQIKASSMNVG